VALVTREVGTDGQGSSASYIYDDATNLVTTISITQSAQGTRSLTVNVLDRADAHVVYTATRGFQSGVSNIDATPLNEHMVSSVDKQGGASVVAPYNFQLQWGPAQ